MYTNFSDESIILIGYDGNVFLLGEMSSARSVLSHLKVRIQKLQRLRLSYCHSVKFLVKCTMLVRLSICASVGRSVTHLGIHYFYIYFSSVKGIDTEQSTDG